MRSGRSGSKQLLENMALYRIQNTQQKQQTRIYFIHVGRIFIPKKLNLMCFNFI